MGDEDRYLIKRYSNRKLYDSVRRRFTTLDEVSQLLESGIKVLVRDHSTGADRTDEVLAQVLGRRAKSLATSSASSSDLLSGLLRGPAKVARNVADQIVPEDGEPTEAEAEAAATADRQQEEIRELRDQVSQLTEAVTLLLKDKAANAGEDDA